MSKNGFGSAVNQRESRLIDSLELDQWLGEYFPGFGPRQEQEQRPLEGTGRPRLVD